MALKGQQRKLKLLFELGIHEKYSKHLAAREFRPGIDLVLEVNERKHLPLPSLTFNSISPILKFPDLQSPKLELLAREFRSIIQIVKACDESF